MKSEWQEPPSRDLPVLDIRWLLQEVVGERIPTPDNVVTSTTTVLIDDVISNLPEILNIITKDDDMLFS